MNPKEVAEHLFVLCELLGDDAEPEEIVDCLEGVVISDEEASEIRHAINDV